MGVVYEAEQVSLGRHVALKILPRQVARDTRMLERFRREARAAARLHHTNIVPVFEVGRDRDICYYTMQFIQGHGLNVVFDELRRLRGSSNERAQNRPGRDDLPLAETRASASSSATVQDGSALRQVVEHLATGRLDRTSPGAVLAETKPIAGEPAFDAPATHENGPGLAVTCPDHVPAGAGEDSERFTFVLDSPARHVVVPTSPTLGESLVTSALLPAGTPLSTIESRRSAYCRSVVRVALQAAQGLAYAHSRGVVHRDIKPSNLLLDTAGVAWITDFGLAKDDEAALTQTGDILGTISYMAPERFRGEGDARVDIYGLGLTLYELLTLERAFDAADQLRLIEQVKSEDPIRPRIHDRRIPLDLETIVLKAIDKDPQRRYATADAMAEDLRRFLNDEPILARRVSLLERYVRWARRHPGVAILGAVLTAVLVAATAASLVAASRFREQAKQQTIIANERETQREKAENSRIDAERARAEAETVVVDMHAARGFLAAERGDSARAMLWFAKAAELARRDPERERVDRIRAQAWEREAVLPVFAVDRACEGLRAIEFQPSGEHLLTISYEGVPLLSRIVDGAEVKLPDASGRALAAAWSADGSLLALGTEGSRVELFRLDDLGGLRRLDARGWVTALAFSVDGSLLAAAGGHTVQVWRTVDGRPVGAPMLHPSYIDSLEFNKQATHLLSGCHNGSWHLFDVPAPTGRPRLEGPAREMTRRNRPRFSVDGKAVVSLAGAHELTWTDVVSGRPTGRGRVRLDLSSALNFDLSPDGRWFAVAGYYGPQIFSVADSSRPPRMLVHSNEVSACQFSPDSKLLATSSWDRTVKLWSLPDGEPVGMPLPHEQIVHGTAFSPDGRHLVTWQKGGLVRVWRIQVPGRTRPLPGPEYVLAHPRPSRDGQRVIPGRFINPFTTTSLGSSPLAVRETANGRVAGPTVQLPGDVQDAVLDAHGRRAAALVRGSGGGALHVWDVDTGQPLFEPRPIGPDPISVDFSPDGRRIATQNQAGTARIIEASSGHTLEAFHTETSDTDRRPLVRFADDRTLVVLHGRSLSAISLASSPPTKRTMTLRGDAGSTAVLAVSADGRFAATAVAGVSGYPVRVWELATGRVASPVLAHPDEVDYMAFADADRRLITAGRDGQLRVWDWAEARLASTPCTTDDEILHFALSPDGRFAFAGVRRGTTGLGKLEVWELATGKSVIPSISFPSSVHGVTLSVDGRHGLAVLNQGGTEAIDFSDLIDEDARPGGELLRDAELAAGQSVLDGDFVGLTTAEWYERWRSSRPQFREAHPPAPVPDSSAAIIAHTAVPASAQAGNWQGIAREYRKRYLSATSNSRTGLIAATYAILAGDDGAYREICRIMVRDLASSEDIEDLERTAKVCLIGRASIAEAQRLAAVVEARLKADDVPGEFVPWGYNLLALAALRGGRFGEAFQWASRFEARMSGTTPYTSAVKAMAELRLGRRQAARQDVARALQAFGGDPSVFLDQAAPDPDGLARSSTAYDVLFAALIVREAQLMRDLDATFPDDPFTAPDSAASP